MFIFQMQHIKHNVSTSMVLSSLALFSAIVAFFIAEPVIGHGQADTSTFSITQTITDETSFLVAPTNVTMVGSISGITGGNATGTTYFVVQSNNSSGYYVELAFEDNTTPVAMLGDVTASEAIHNYGGDASGQPSYGFTSSSSSQFAYTVTSSTTADTDQSFKHDGASACNTGSNTTPDVCWKAPSTTAFRIVDRSSSATTGATTSVKFKVNVPSSASPIPLAETYTATATVSLYVK